MKKMNKSNKMVNRVRITRQIAIFLALVLIVSSLEIFTNLPIAATVEAIIRILLLAANL
ncbi:MAG: hypothetical protein FWC97_02140 [Treponema sp.]|nr:hypothetical protein [Treponema sp.]